MNTFTSYIAYIYPSPVTKKREFQSLWDTLYIVFILNIFIVWFLTYIIFVIWFVLKELHKESWNTFDYLFGYSLKLNWTWKKKYASSIDFETLLEYSNETSPFWKVKEDTDKQLRKCKTCIKIRFQHLLLLARKALVFFCAFLYII